MLLNNCAYTQKTELSYAGYKCTIKEITQNKSLYTKSLYQGRTIRSGVCCFFFPPKIYFSAQACTLNIEAVVVRYKT